MRLGRKEIAHLYNRAAFGIDFESFQELSSSTAKEEVDRLFSRSFQSKSLEVFGDFPQLEIFRKLRSGELTREQARKEIREAVDASREKIRDLNTSWIAQMHAPESAGLERLVFFWHNHFGVRVLNGFLAQQHNNNLRKHALGPFKKLLLAVAKDPAMLNFLNNQQSVKSKPNENFARELMELFTIGRGNYSETDVKEAARAFTGWRFERRSGEFILDRRNHDFGSKSFFGQTGDLDGEDIINILLEDKRTAQFLAKKFYMYYVEDKPNDKRIEQLAGYYYDSDYHTESLLRFLFSQDWFYDSLVQRAKIKSPIDLINSLKIQLDLGFNNSLGWIVLQRNFNQVLFYPPSVAGWPSGQEWIDSTSLVKRMQLPSALVGLDLTLEDLPEIDASDPFKNFDRKRVLRGASILSGTVEFDTSTLIERFDLLVDYLLGGKINSALRLKIFNQFQKIPIHLKTKWLFSTLASLPEFQMT